MRLPLTMLLVASTAIPVLAQKVCVSANENISNELFSIGEGWYAVKVTVTQATVVTAVEVNLYATQNGTPGQIAIYDENLGTGKPNQQLRSLAPIVNAAFGYYGSAFTPLFFAPGQSFFVASRIGTSGLSYVGPGLHRSAGTRVPHWHQGFATSTWSGPSASSTSMCWRYRVYCNLHTGVTNTYGSAKPGTFGRLPRLTGLGFANLGNPLTLQLTNAPRNAPAAILLGTRAQVPLSPFGTFYVFPITVTVPGVLGGIVGPDFDVNLSIPNNASLTGAGVAAQAWIADTAAVRGFSHSSGVEFVIGT